MRRETKLVVALVLIGLAAVLVFVGVTSWGNADDTQARLDSLGRDVGIRLTADEPDHTASYIMFGVAGFLGLCGVIFLATLPPKPELPPPPTLPPPPVG